MNPADAVPVWDGCPLRDGLIGLAWPDTGSASGAFAASDGNRVVLVPDERFADFLNAHPGSRFAADLDHTRCFVGTDGAVNRVVLDNRLYPIGLLSALVRQAAPRGNAPPCRHLGGDAWVADSGRLRDAAARLLDLADEAIERVEVGRRQVSRFGPLGIGLDVRGALAAADGVAGVRVAGHRLNLVKDKLAARKSKASAALAESRAAKTFAHKVGRERFLDTGDPGDNGDHAKALATFVRDLCGLVRFRDDLVAPAPEDSKDMAAWRLLAPHSKAVAAWIELVTVNELLTALEGSPVLRPHPLSFPELRYAGPDLTYLRRWAGPRALSPTSDDEMFVVVRIPDLELRALASCLVKRAGDGALAELIRRRGVDGVREELILRTSNLSVDDLVLHAQRDSQEFRSWTEVSRATLAYASRGVDQANLENWLVQYEFGILPRAMDLKRAREALEGLAPALRDYCSVSAEQLAAGNLRSTVPELRTVLGSLIGTLGTDADQSVVRSACDILLSEYDPNRASANNRLWRAFTSRERFSQNPLASRSFLLGADLIRALLGADHITPTGRMYGQAPPIQVIGRDHLELADGVRKAVYYALVANGHRVAGFAGDEFAVLVPKAGAVGGGAPQLETLSRNALAGWADEIAEAVTAQLVSDW